jgi:hypothetical protein
MSTLKALILRHGQFMLSFENNKDARNHHKCNVDTWSMESVAVSGVEPGQCPIIVWADFYAIILGSRLFHIDRNCRGIRQVQSFLFRTMIDYWKEKVKSLVRKLYVRWRTFKVTQDLLRVIASPLWFPNIHRTENP